jgi:predicted kinase
MKHLLSLLEFKTEEKPTITFLIGPPASGKSTYIRNTVSSGDVIISRDDIVDELRSVSGLSYNDAFQNPELQLNVNIFLYQKLDDALNAKKNIIIDMVNIKKDNRKKFLDRVPKDYIKKAIVFNVDKEELIKRAIERDEKTGKYVPLHIIDSMTDNLDQPTEDEFDIITRL